MESKFNKIGKFIMIAVSIYIVGAIATSFAFDQAPTAQTPTAQKLFDNANYQKCLAEVNLVNAKIADYANGLIELTEEDIVRLHEKRNNDCPLS